MTEFVRDREIEFLLYEFLDTTALHARPRYAEQDRTIYDEILRSARAASERYLLPFYQKGDEKEVQMVDGAVVSTPEVILAWRAICDGGFMDMSADVDAGGLQVPEVISRAVQTYFQSANTSFAVYPFLTQGVINLIRSFGTQAQQELWIPQLVSGTSIGTMALTEPAQGSALADITTRAEPQKDGTWLIFGQKIYISAGDSDVAHNIVHMVLAKTKGAPAGAAGISLFLTPKWLPDDEGKLSKRNDVHLAGVLHKMGQRSSPTTALSFGDNGGAVGWLVGEEGKGLAAMFQMMNEARIGVGIISAALAYRGFLYSLHYASERPQGRLPSSKDPKSPQVMLTKHADVRRLLLMQKCYSEGALALCFFAASLFEDQHTHPDIEERKRSGLLLDLLTPIVKSWSAKYGCASNDQAIQILGGAGYTREYIVEQLYRDQRINPIHEGAEAIHGLDILSRKVRISGGAAVNAFAAQVTSTIEAAERSDQDLPGLARDLKKRLERLIRLTQDLLERHTKDADEALANATIYLDVFGRVCVAWLWLKQAVVAQEKKDTTQNEALYYEGKLTAARYYLEWELPQTDRQMDLLETPNLIPFRANPKTF